MKQNKEVLIGVLFLSFFLISTASPALAYSYPGYKWQQGYAYYTTDSTVPSSWSTSIYNGLMSWNNAGSSFRFYTLGTTNNKLYYSGLGSNGATAVTYTFATGSSISKNTVYFNSDKSWSTTGASGTFDVQSVAVHEFGHWLHLDDLPSNSEPVMYAHLEMGQTKRSLTSDDKNGIRHIYP